MSYIDIDADRLDLKPLDVMVSTLHDGLGVRAFCIYTRAGDQDGWEFVTWHQLEEYFDETLLRVAIAEEVDRLLR